MCDVYSALSTAILHQIITHIFHGYVSMKVDVLIERHICKPTDKLLEQLNIFSITQQPKLFFTGCYT